MNILANLGFLVVLCFLISTCSINAITQIAEIELKTRGYIFEKGWKPRAPGSKVRCKKWPEFGEHAEYCEVVK